MRRSLLCLTLFALSTPLVVEAGRPKAAMAPPEEQVPAEAAAAEGAAPAEAAAVEGEAAEAAAPVDEAAAAQAAFEASLRYTQGEISLRDGLATLRVPETFRYLDSEDTNRLLQAWGNPPDPTTLGMIVPAEVSPLEAAGWGVIVSYDEDGHVKDDDAADIDYDDLLAEMKEGTREDNKARAEAGYPPVDLIGWADPPHYDSAAKKLYWAKELSFDGSPEHTLNYDIRILGRRGVLVLSAVAGMGQLGQMKQRMPEILAFTDFNPGHTYAEFDPDVDEVAAYGVGALVAGKMAAKAGLFKSLLAILVAGKKFVVLAVVGLIAGLKRLFTGEDSVRK